MTMPATRRSVLAAGAWAVPVLAAVAIVPTAAASDSGALSVSTARAWLYPDESTTVRAISVDGSGRPRTGEPVTLALGDPAQGVICQPSGVTDASGVYETTLRIRTGAAAATGTLTATSARGVGATSFEVRPAAVIVHDESGISTRVTALAHGSQDDVVRYENRGFAHSDLQPTGRHVVAGDVLDVVVDAEAPATLSLVIGARWPWRDFNGGQGRDLSTVALTSGRQSITAVQDGIVFVVNTSTVSAGGLTISGGRAAPRLGERPHEVRRVHRSTRVLGVCSRREPGGGAHVRGGAAPPGRRPPRPRGVMGSRRDRAAYGLRRGLHLRRVWADVRRGRHRPQVSRSRVLLRRRFESRLSVRHQPVAVLPGRYRCKRSAAHRRRRLGYLARSRAHTPDAVGVLSADSATLYLGERDATAGNVSGLSSLDGSPSSVTQRESSAVNVGATEGRVLALLRASDATPEALWRTVPVTVASGLEFVGIEDTRAGWVGLSADGKRLVVTSTGRAPHDYYFQGKLYYQVTLQNASRRTLVTVSVNGDQTHDKVVAALNGVSVSSGYCLRVNAAEPSRVRVYQNSAKTGALSSTPQNVVIRNGRFVV